MPPKNVNELLSTEHEASASSSVSVVASNSCHGANESMTQKPVARPNSQASLPENLGSCPGSKLNTPVCPSLFTKKFKTPAPRLYATSEEAVLISPKRSTKDVSMNSSAPNQEPCLLSEESRLSHKLCLELLADPDKLFRDALSREIPKHPLVNATNLNKPARTKTVAVASNITSTTVTLGLSSPNLELSASSSKSELNLAPTSKHDFEPTLEGKSYAAGDNNYNYDFNNVVYHGNTSNNLVASENNSTKNVTSTTSFAVNPASVTLKTAVQDQNEAHFVQGLNAQGPYAPKARAYEVAFESFVQGTKGAPLNAKEATFCSKEATLTKNLKLWLTPPETGFDPEEFAANELPLLAPSAMTQANYEDLEVLKPYFLKNSELSVGNKLNPGDKLDAGGKLNASDELKADLEQGSKREQSSYRTLPTELADFVEMVSWLKSHPFYAPGICKLPVSLRRLRRWSYGDLMLDWKVRPLLLRSIGSHLDFTPNIYDSTSLLPKIDKVDHKSLLPHAILCCLAHEGLSPAVSSDTLYPLFTGANRNTMINNCRYYAITRVSPFCAMPFVTNMPINVRPRILNENFTENISRDITRGLYTFLDIYRNVNKSLQAADAHISFNAFDVLVALKTMRHLMLAEVDFLVADQIETDFKNGTLKFDLSSKRVVPPKNSLAHHNCANDPRALNATSQTNLVPGSSVDLSSLNLDAQDYEAICQAYAPLRATILRRNLKKYITLSNIVVYAPYYADRLGKEFVYCTGSEFCLLPTYVFVNGDTPLNDLLFYNVSRQKETLIRGAIRFAFAPLM